MSSIYRLRRNRVILSKVCVVILVFILALLYIIDWKTTTSIPRQLFNRFYLGKTFEIKVLSDLNKLERVTCDGNLRTYVDNFSHTKNILVNKCVDEESCSKYNVNGLQPGYFSLQCGFSGFSKPYFQGSSGNHLTKWMAAMMTIRSSMGPPSTYQSDFTIAIMRYEYVNMYHSMTDVYNAYLMMRFYHRDSYVHILLVDDHPRGALYPWWDKLFYSVTHISNASRITKYDNMVWNILGYNSPMYFHNTYLPTIPLLEDFREFFLRKHNVSTDEHKVLCGFLKVTFIWRRDYVAHPNNPSGLIKRKIANEGELVKSLKIMFPKYTIRGVQLDQLEMKEQLEHASTTDIMIGMHGAGLTHAMFLPKSSGMIELFPKYWSAGNPRLHIGNTHFLGIAQWRKLHYEQWTNTNSLLENDNFSTIIPPDVILQLVEQISRKMCRDK